MNHSQNPTFVTRADLLEKWDAFLLDAYGVLVNAEGALPGADSFIKSLTAMGKDYRVVTNDASRLPKTIQNRFLELGMKIPTDKILTSGHLLHDYFEKNHLVGAVCAVLGTDDSKEYVRQAGGTVIAASNMEVVDVVVIADDDGFPFLPQTEMTLSMIVRTLESGKTPTLLLPNPDIIYPKNSQEFGFTAGAIALLIEAALRRLCGSNAPDFVPLGKPNPGLFQMGMAAMGGKMVMVGDQIETDILGANRIRLDSVLATTGVSSAEIFLDSARSKEADAALATPTHILKSLSA